MACHVHLHWAQMCVVCACCRGWEERRWQWAGQYEEEQWTLGLLSLPVTCSRLSWVQLQPYRRYRPLSPK